MAYTNLKSNIRFGLCFLVITCARLVAGDNSDLLPRLYELLSKNKQPLLLVLDHSDLKATRLDNNQGFNSLERDDLLSPFLNRLYQNSMLEKRPRLQTKSNKLNYQELYQSDQDKNYRDKRYREDNDKQVDRERLDKNGYKLDQERNLQGRHYDRHDRHRDQLDRNRDSRYRYRNKHSGNSHLQNRHRSQYDRDSNQHSRYEYDEDRHNGQSNQRNENADLLDRYTNLLYQQRPYQQNKNRNTRDDRNQSRLDRVAKYDRQSYNDRRERKRGLKSPSPVIRSLLRMSKKLECGAREECQNECDDSNENDRDSCEDICEEKFDCDDEKEEKVTGSTKGPLIENEEVKCKRC